MEGEIFLPWLNSILLMWLNCILLIGFVFSIAFAVIIFKRSSNRDLPFLSFVIAIGFICTFFIVHYTPHWTKPTNIFWLPAKGENSLLVIGGLTFLFDEHQLSLSRVKMKKHWNSCLNSQCMFTFAMRELTFFLY